ncbi:MAG: nitroreductase family protein [Caldilineaceae bacterium]|nr:nitroreductase family protein [Caldilineaceae bacterium]
MSAKPSAWPPTAVAPHNGQEPVPDPALDWPVLQRLVRQRRSIRRYTDQPIDRGLLEDLLDAATWAPSAHNRQPWRFCVVTGGAAKQQLSAAMGARWRADLSADGADPAEIERRVAISHARITGAAALVIASLSLEEMDIYPDAARSQAEWTMAVQSVALACQNLLLAAHAAGLGACWMCAPLFVPELVQTALALPSAWQPQALITLGYPAETKTKGRVPLSSRVIWR